MLDPCDVFIRRIPFKDNQPRTADPDICLGLDQPHTVHRRSSPLVELARKILYCYVFLAFKIT